MTVSISPRTLVEAFLPLTGTAPLGLIYDTANEIGLADQPVRLAVRRLISAGDIEQTGRGRGGALRLTPLGRTRLGNDRLGFQLAAAQDHGEAPWDGRWRLYSFSAPEDHRALRDRFRRTITQSGAVAISTGLYLSPHTLHSFFDPSDAQWLVEAEAQSVTVRGIGEPEAIAEALWPAKPIVAEYSHVAESCGRAMADAAPLLRQLWLAEAFERAMRSDPLLPPELRSQPWTPSTIRQEWRTLWHRASGESGVRLFDGWLDDELASLA